MPALMAFVVLEGFSGTGKTTLAKGLEGMGWVRLEESAHAVPKTVPLADRADTFADFSLLGATMINSSPIFRLRKEKMIVSEGYLLSDLAYAKIRHELGKSGAFPAMLEMCKGLLKNEQLRPDLYVVLQARPETVGSRQMRKVDRERNDTAFFRERYYATLNDMHEELGEKNQVPLYTDSDPQVTLKSLVSMLRERGFSP